MPACPRHLDVDCDFCVDVATCLAAPPELRAEAVTPTPAEAVEARLSGLERQTTDILARVELLEGALAAMSAALRRRLTGEGEE